MRTDPIGIKGIEKADIFIEKSNHVRYDHYIVLRNRGPQINLHTTRWPGPN